MKVSKLYRCNGLIRDSILVLFGADGLELQFSDSEFGVYSVVVSDQAMFEGIVNLLNDAPTLSKNFESRFTHIGDDCAIEIHEVGSEGSVYFGVEILNDHGRGVILTEDDAKDLTNFLYGP